jgi:hypothetical protein
MLGNDTTGAPWGFIARAMYESGWSALSGSKCANDIVANDNGEPPLEPGAATLCLNKEEMTDGYPLKDDGGRNCRS